MTTVLSEKGQIVLPLALRKRMHLKKGEDFEVRTEDDDTIILRRIFKPANHGLLNLLMTCPFSFELPSRDKDDSLPLSL